MEKQKLINSSGFVADKIENNFLNAICALQVLDAANSEAIIRGYDDTVEANIYNVICNSLVNEVLLHLSKIIEQGGRDRCNLEKGLHILSNDNACEILCEKTSLNKEQFLEEVYSVRKKINQLMSLHRKAFIEFRNCQLAHSLDKEMIHSIKYGDIYNLVSALKPLIYRLLVLLDGVSRDFDAYEEHYKDYADRFWAGLTAVA